MWVLWAAALAAIVIDQLSKAWVFGLLDLPGQGQIDVLPPYLVFRHGLNTGVNFGLFADASTAQRVFLIALSLGLCLLLWLWARRSFQKPIEFFFGGLVIGGALGNVIDRILFPGVRDFLNMSCCGIENPYVFNVADIFIFAGAFGLVLFGGKRDTRKNPS